MELFKLTPKRREALGNFFLNMAVACFAVAAFEGKWWGFFAAIVAVLEFFAVTKGE